MARSVSERKRLAEQRWGDHEGAWIGQIPLLVQAVPAVRALAREPVLVLLAQSDIQELVAGPGKRAQVQTVTLRYVHAQTGLPTDAAHFTGNMTLLSSLRKVLSSATIRTQVHIGHCIASDGHTRKSLAHQAHLNIHGQLSRRPHGEASNA